MVTLSLMTDYLARLVAKTRGIQAQEGEVDVDPGSNPIDDRMIDAVQDTRGDLSREEIRGLNDRQQAELVALLWLGRGDFDPEDWESAVGIARDRRDTPTEDYLLSQPLVAELWAEGAERLGIALPVEAIEERR